MTTMINMFLKEMEQEAKTTRKMLACIPEDKYDWKPHEKSMSMHNLATHIAELPGWVSMTIHTDGLDFNENKYEPKVVKSNEELMQFMEKTVSAAQADLEKSKDAILSKIWVLRSGETIHSTANKGETIRMTFNQITHHRAQLGVYLRLLNIPIPGSYGPSADDHGF